MELLHFLEGLRTPFLDAVMSLLTHLGEETLFMLVALVFFWCLDKHRGYFLLFVGFTGTVCIQILKMIFRIPRPWVLEPDFTIVESAREEATGYSFPSGHTQCATNIYGGIARSSKRRWVRVCGVLLFLLVALSRMYLGVHTPLDVGVSLLLGIGLVLLFYPIMKQTEKKPTLMYGVIGAVLLLSLGNLLFVMLYSFPADVDAQNLANAQKVAWQLFFIVLGMCILYPVDQKWLHFRTDAVWWAQILKLVGGAALIVAIRTLLKAPFNALLGVNLGSGLRYFVMVLVAGIVWPMTFPFFARLGRKEK